MSAGTVMSAPTGDFTAPPYKRQRKAEEPPHNKGIKNYFSPVCRSLDKVVSSPLLSSPRSSNIADYFIRSATIADKECEQSPPEHRDPHNGQLTAEHRDLCNGQLASTPLTASSRASRRTNKAAKRTKLIHRLEGEDGNAHPSAAHTTTNTCALPAHICSNAQDLDDDGGQSSKLAQQAIKTRLRSLKRKHETPNGPSIDLTIAAEPAHIHTIPSSDSPSTLTDSSLEVHMDSSSTSLATISFEDFLKSQAEKDSLPSGSPRAMDPTASSGSHRASKDPTPSGSTAHRASKDPTASGSHRASKNPMSSGSHRALDPMSSGSHRVSKDPTASSGSHRASKNPMSSGSHRASMDPTASSGSHRASKDPTSSGSTSHRASMDSVSSGSTSHRASKDPTASGSHRASKDPIPSGSHRALDTTPSGSHIASKDPTASGLHRASNDLTSSVSTSHTPCVDDQDIPSATSDPEPSPKTVTIQAQVHLSPPLSQSSSPSRAPTKMASIFCKKKAGHATRRSRLGEHVVQKRKSNVVIEEEDLELAVIDVDNVEPMKAKSTAAERQQFMKAFRQAGEMPKPTGKKCAGKKKDVNPNPADGSDEQNNGEPREESPDGDQGNPAEMKPEEPAKRLKLKQGVNKPKKVGSEKPTIPSTNERRAKPEHRSHEASETQQKSPVLRRSLRRQRSDITTSSPWTADEHPALMSTPKVTPSSSSSDLYKSEVLTVPSDAETPIRMRFTRITRRISDRQHDDEVLTPGHKKLSSNAKKMKKAKQLLEKAKAIQQNIAKAEIPRRRSARQEKRLSQEHILIDDTKSSICKSQEEANTKLRSLNDVLGKKVKASTSGAKKEVKRVPQCAVITVDDGSETSDNSQDDGEFKARREFLMSGLPDSLKRNLAKAAALREAYTRSSMSFHSVLHVQQRDGCDMWRLHMPRCLTTRVPDSLDVLDVASITMSIGDVTSCSAPLALQQLPDMMCRKVVFSEAVRERLMEEIRCCNPHFPVRRFLSQLLKKHNDYVASQDFNKTGGKQTASHVTIGDAEEDDGVKRKDTAGLKCKRVKSGAIMDEGKETSAGKGRKGRLSRGRSRHPHPEVIIIDEEDKAEPHAGDAICEDVLWTEKYQPHASSQLIGNSLAIRRLHSWLRDWKSRAEKEEKRNELQKTGKDKNDTWQDLHDFHDDDSDDESLCNTMLITGPSGVGKTAAVYACAQELGFKVFEVNASCQRNGRQILAQLKEATQSHQVDQQGVNAHKPCFLNTPSLGKSPRKINSPKTVVSSPRKPPMSPRGGKKGLAPKSLASFFKAAPKQKAAAEQGKAAPIISDRMTNKAVTTLPFMMEKGGEESQRKSATSLILFEEVDVIFDEDSGFLSAIKTFMSTTKRPVILTSSDPMFGSMFDGVFEEIAFHTPSMLNVATYLQLLCLAENVRTDMKDMMTLLTANMCDIRQSVLQLQWWACSGGGMRGDGASAAPNQANHLPPCNRGCAENMLGLCNVMPATPGLLPYVRDHMDRAEERDRIIHLLAEFQMANVDFTSCNLEYLLPLPLCVTEDPAPCEAIDLAPPTDTMRRRKKLVLLDDSDLFADDDSEDDLPAEQSPSNMAVESSSHHAPMQRKLPPTQLAASCLLYTCLDSLATFADNLSYMDCWSRRGAEEGDACNHSWRESRLKPGLCDEPRIETADAMMVCGAADIRAHIEGLAFHACSRHITKALDTSLEQCRQSGYDPTPALTLHVSKSRDDVCFMQHPAVTSTSLSRLSIIRTVLSQRAFTALGNRQVNVTEYLPALRTICRIEKTKEEGKTKRRFLHYLEGIHLELPKKTLISLAADFP